MRDRRYLDTDREMKEGALAKTTRARVARARYQPNDSLLASLTTVSDPSSAACRR